MLPNNIEIFLKMKNKNWFSIEKNKKCGNVQTRQNERLVNVFLHFGLQP